MGRTLNVVLAGLLLLALFFALNMVAGVALRGARLDATEGKLYTLTAGSKRIAASGDEPVTLKLYYSAKLAQGRPEIQSYAQRVREMLEEYVRAGGGKVRLEVIDPEPFSEAEDAAVAAGLTGVPVNTAGEALYLGLVGTNAVNTKETVTFFDPRKERFLEYDLSRLLYSLTHPKRRTIGLISGLPMEGGYSIDPRTRQPAQTPAWQVMNEIKGVFDVTTLRDPVSIPKDLAALMVVHPKDLSERAVDAIDQYVLGGGKLLLFVDPSCDADEGGGMGAPPEAKSSSLATLLDNWGVEVPPTMVAADNVLAQTVLMGSRSRPEQVSYVVWLGCDKRAMVKDDIVTGTLGTVNFATSGFLRAKDGAAQHVTISPMVKTTATAMAMPVSALGFPPDPKALSRQYVPGKESLTLAARLSGRVKSAFPAGRPPAKQGQEDTPAPAGERLTESTGDISVIVVADCDVLSDPMWARQQNFFGQTTLVKLADNADFVLSALDNLSGSNDLISVRARRESARPFTTVQDMERRAQERSIAEQKLLEDKQKDTEQRLAELQGKRSDDQGALVLSPEQEKEVEKFRSELLDTRKKLRAIRKAQRDDIEALGVKLKLINTALVPVLVSMFAVGLGLLRRSRRAESVRRASKEVAS